MAWLASDREITLRVFRLQRATSYYPKDSNSGLRRGSRDLFKMHSVLHVPEAMQT